MNILIVIIVSVLSAYLGFMVHAMLSSGALIDAQWIAALYAALVKSFVTAYECSSTCAPDLAMIAAYSAAKKVLRGNNA